jgi:hypothetical protein
MKHSALTSSFSDGSPAHLRSIICSRSDGEISNTGETSHRSASSGLTQRCRSPV